MNKNTDLFSRTQSILEQHTLSNIPKYSNQIHPNYGGYSIANLPDSICTWLDIPSIQSNSLAKLYEQDINGPFEHIILFLIDGLNLRVFNRYLEEEALNPGNYGKDILSKGTFLPLTSVCPSTTAAALTTLWTGRQPCEHGIIGYELFLKEFGLIANMITHSVASFIQSPVNISHAGFDPFHFLPVESLGSHLKKHAVQSFALQHESIANSGLSQMLFKDVNQVSFSDLNSLFRYASQIQDQHIKKSFTYVYWSGIDTLSHRFGPGSDILFQEWMVFAKSLNSFLESETKKSRKKTLFLLVADHGQIATEINSAYDLHNHPILNQHLTMVPTGESRLPFLTIKHGSVHAVIDYLQTHWGNNFHILPVENVQCSGLFGNREYHQTTIDRMGSHVIFPRENAYWWWVEKENTLLGRHGGLSCEEMLVPFVAMEI